VQTLVVGVVNVTPDSFYDGNHHFATVDAIAHGRRLADEGADILDIGGESSRPGAALVSEVEELRRVLPVIEALAPLCRISIDTMKANVAAQAVSAGASLVNDVSCALGEVAAEAGVGIVLMHMKGRPKDMQVDPTYGDVVSEVFSYLADAATRARQLGIEEIYVDPGIGFGKTTQHNLALLRSLPQLVASDVPVFIGTSRKRFIGEISAAHDGETLPLDQRFEGSLASATWAMSCGVAAVRVHDVKATKQAARVVGDLVSSSSRMELS
jgi:dihydropteroate synthase